MKYYFSNLEHASEQIHRNEEIPASNDSNSPNNGSHRDQIKPNQSLQTSNNNVYSSNGTEHDGTQQNEKSAASNDSVSSIKRISDCLTGSEGHDSPIQLKKSLRRRIESESSASDLNRSSESEAERLVLFFMYLFASNLISLFYIYLCHRICCYNCLTDQKYHFWK